MGIFTTKSESRGHSLIAAELNNARQLLRDREEDLVKTEKHAADLRSTIEGLRKKVADLEHDERALTRGYLAIMGERSAAAGPGV